MRIASFDIGSRNFALCLLSACDNVDTVCIDTWDVVDLYPKHKVLQNLTQLLDNHRAAFATCDVALVEKQLASKNHAATRLAHHVHSWFAIFLPHVKIVSYHAHHKTSAFTDARMPKPERKRFCISLAIEFLGNCRHPCARKALAQLLGAPKKDDLADTLCQALSYIKACGQNKHDFAHL